MTDATTTDRAVHWVAPDDDAPAAAAAAPAVAAAAPAATAAAATTAATTAAATTATTAAAARRGDAPVDAPAAGRGRRLGPIARRRLANFRANRRGYWSFWLFLGLFVLSLFADVIANERPLLVRHEGQFYFPTMISYPETDFGGIFQTEAKYRESCAPGDGCVRDLVHESGGWMIWPLIPFSYDTIDQNLPTPAPSPPTWTLDKEARAGPSAMEPEFDRDGLSASLGWHWLGSDDQGRDVAARLIYGFRISVLFGLTLTVLSSVIGIIAGAAQGYLGGWVDLSFQRFIEVWTSVPQLYLLIILASVIEPGFWILLGIMLLFSWVALVGVVRAEFLRGRNFEYVRAARALGARTPTIMFRHLLPNAMVATLTFAPFILNASITTLTALDFLGFGMPPGSPSLGEMLKQGKDNLQAPWLGLTSFLVIALMLSLLVFIFEAVRDAFDPRKVFTGPQAAETAAEERAA